MLLSIFALPRSNSMLDVLSGTPWLFNVAIVTRNQSDRTCRAHTRSAEYFWDWRFEEAMMSIFSDDSLSLCPPPASSTSSICSFPSHALCLKQAAGKTLRVLFASPAACPAQNWPQSFSNYSCIWQDGDVAPASAGACSACRVTYT